MVSGVLVVMLFVFVINQYLAMELICEAEDSHVYLIVYFSHKHLRNPFPSKKCHRH